MKNIHGLDIDYFKRKIRIVLRDIDNYTEDELRQEFNNMINALPKLDCDGCSYNGMARNKFPCFGCIRVDRIDEFSRGDKKWYKELRRLRVLKKEDSFYSAEIKKFNYHYLIYISIWKFRFYLKLWDYRRQK